MPTQNINATLSTADAQAIRDSFAAVINKLPFLINMTPAERKAVVKTGPDSVSFIQNALAAAKDHPAILPASFDIQAFERDVILFEVLVQLATIAASIASQIDDTRLAVGGEAMQQAMQVYQYVKTAAKTTPGLKPVAEQLGERFKKAKRSKEAPKPTS